MLLRSVRNVSTSTHGIITNINILIAMKTSTFITVFTVYSVLSLRLILSPPKIHISIILPPTLIGLQRYVPFRICDRFCTNFLSKASPTSSSVIVLVMFIDSQELFIIHFFPSLILRHHPVVQFSSASCSFQTSLDRVVSLT